AAVWRDGDGGETWIAQSAADGSFRASGLERGTLSVHATGVHGKTRQSVTVALEPGTPGELELVLAPAGGTTAKIHAASGAPLECKAELVDASGNSLPVFFPEKGSAWLSLLQAGSYTLRATSGNLHGERKFDVRGDEPELKLELTLQ